MPAGMSPSRARTDPRRLWIAVRIGAMLVTSESSFARSSGASAVRASSVASRATPYSAVAPTTHAFAPSSSARVAHSSESAEAASKSPRSSWIAALAISTSTREIASPPRSDSRSELAIRLVGPGERTLDPLDVGARLVVGPAGLRAADRRAQPQLGLRLVREGGGAIEERHGLAVREALQRVLARENEIFGRASRLSGLLEMHRDYRGALALSLRI